MWKKKSIRIIKVKRENPDTMNTGRIIKIVTRAFEIKILDIITLYSNNFPNRFITVGYTTGNMD